MSNWESPVIMIGIDAATWDVIDPLLEAGKMPHIARLRAEGTAAELHSMTDYVSPALWTTITTGKMPEEHGILDFYSATRLNRRSPTIYDILCGESGKVGLFRWFATWPPMENHGFTVPSAVARSPETFPADLQFLNDLLRPSGFESYASGAAGLVRHGGKLSTLAKAVGQILSEMILRPPAETTWYQRRLLESEIYTDVFVHLLRRYEPEFAAFLLFHTDDLSHRYWKYREPQKFDHVRAEKVRRYQSVIDRAYMAADRAAGRILKVIPDDSLVIVLSDHGQEAGPAMDAPLRMSQRLLRSLGCADDVWLTYVGYSAYLRMRDPDEGERSLRQIRDDLAGIKLENDGRPIFQVQQSGPRQIVVDVADGIGDQTSEAALLPGNRRSSLDKVVFSDGRLSGTHSERGILLMRGPNVRKGHWLDPATILDVAPTLLALRGKPVARDMPGNVLVEAFSRDFDYKEEFIESYDDRLPVGTPEEPEGEQLAELEARLRSLGYLSE